MLYDTLKVYHRHGTACAQAVPQVPVAGICGELRVRVRACRQRGAQNRRAAWCKNNGTPPTEIPPWHAPPGAQCVRVRAGAQQRAPVKPARGARAGAQSDRGAESGGSCQRYIRPSTRHTRAGAHALPEQCPSCPFTTHPQRTRQRSQPRGNSQARRAHTITDARRRDGGRELNHAVARII